MQIQVRINASGWQWTSARMRGKLHNLRVPLKRSGALLLQSFMQNIKAGGRPTPFKSLSEMTIAMRRQGKGPERGGAKPLLDTGALMNSLIPGSRGNISILGKNQISVGSAKEYASRHIFGEPSSILGVPVPIRDFMAVQDSDVDRITDIFYKHFFH